MRLTDFVLPLDSNLHLAIAWLSYTFPENFTNNFLNHNWMYNIFQIVDIKLIISALIFKFPKSIIFEIIAETGKEILS
jgi:hypothetical protein